MRLSPANTTNGLGNKASQVPADGADAQRKWLCVGIVHSCFCKFSFKKTEEKICDTSKYCNFLLLSAN